MAAKRLADVMGFDVPALTNLTPENVWQAFFVLNPHMLGLERGRIIGLCRRHKLQDLALLLTAGDKFMPKTQRMDVPFVPRTNVGALAEAATSRNTVARGRGMSRGGSGQRDGSAPAVLTSTAIVVSADVRDPATAPVAEHIDLTEQEMDELTQPAMQGSSSVPPIARTVEAAVNTSQPIPSTSSAETPAKRTRIALGKHL